MAFPLKCKLIYNIMFHKMIDMNLMRFIRRTKYQYEKGFYCYIALSNNSTRIHGYARFRVIKGAGENPI